MQNAGHTDRLAFQANLTFLVCWFVSLYKVQFKGASTAHVIGPSDQKSQSFYFERCFLRMNIFKYLINFELALLKNNTTNLYYEVPVSNF